MFCEGFAKMVAPLHKVVADLAGKSRPGGRSEGCLDPTRIQGYLSGGNEEGTRAIFHFPHAVLSCWSRGLNQARSDPLPMIAISAVHREGDSILLH